MSAIAKRQASGKAEPKAQRPVIIASIMLETRLDVTYRGLVRAVSDQIAFAWLYIPFFSSARPASFAIRRWTASVMVEVGSNDGIRLDLCHRLMTALSAGSSVRLIADFRDWS